ELPTAEDGVDPTTRLAMGSTIEQQTALVKQENGAVDSAERYARRETRAILGLSLSASAAALLGLAGLVGASRAGRLLLSVAVLALLGAVASGALALSL